MRRRSLALASLVTALAVGLGACSSGSGDEESGKETVTVLAASSLTEAFTDLKNVYESEHPDARIKISFDSSSVLAEQVVQGNPADVLATADERTMKTVTKEDLTLEQPQTFATNTLVIATPPDNPADIKRIQDLGGNGVSYAACVPEAPCGAATGKRLDIDGVTAEPKTEEQNVKGVLTKVTLGAVDAGLVYASDAKAAGDKVHVVEPANTDDVVNTYPIAVLAGSEHQDAAQQWVDLIKSKRGQQTLASYGFGSRSAG